METEGPLLHLKTPSTFSYPEPDQPSPCPIPLPNYPPAISAQVFQLASFPQVSHRNPICISSLPIHATCRPPITFILI
jgi:hypothetical protein